MESNSASTYDVEGYPSLSRYGEYLGLAFQIADHLLDVKAGVAVEERAESGHMERKKAKYPSVVGVVTARERLAELLQLSVRELDGFERRGQPLAAIARYIVGRAFISMLHGRTEEVYA